MQNLINKNGTSPEKVNGEQLSQKALQEIIRPHIPRLIEQALLLAENCTNENVRLGAIKLLMAKVIPDLKAAATENIEDGQVKVTICDFSESLNKVYGNNCESR